MEGEGDDVAVEDAATALALTVRGGARAASQFNHRRSLSNSMNGFSQRIAIQNEEPYCEVGDSEVDAAD